MSSARSCVQVRALGLDDVQVVVGPRWRCHGTFATAEIHGAATHQPTAQDHHGQVGVVVFHVGL